MRAHPDAIPSTNPTNRIRCARPTEATAAEPEVLTERKPKEEAGEADKAGGEKKK